MNPDYFPPQVGLPLAGVFVAVLLLGWWRDRSGRGGHA